MSKKKIKENKPDIYGELADFQGKLHAQNLKRIHIGLLCVLIIPMIFLALMFITDSNKVIWLILWIVSLFAISAYLIVVEYGDYNLQHRINSITGNEAEPVPLLESGINGMNGKIASVKAEARDILASAKESVNIDEDKGISHAASDIYSSEIDTDIIKKSLASDSSLENDASTEASVSKDKKKKSSGKKDKKKKDKDKKHKKDKDKKDKKDGKDIKKKNKSGNKSDNAKADDSESSFMDESGLENNHSKKSEKDKNKKKDKKKKNKKSTSKNTPKSSTAGEYSASDSDNEYNGLSTPNGVSLKKPFSENSLFADDSLKNSTVGNSASMDSADTGNNTESRFVGYNLVKEDEFDE